ncbi:MAG TPA: hypothetical protein VKB80_19855 [Kofleriaceae bacterium]|nr:hypothetical protein [Kofleriaceae bacterium]
MNPGQRHPGRAPAALAPALRAALVVVAAALALGSVPAAAQPPARPSPRPAQSGAEPPDLAALRAAFLSGAPDELARAGQRLSASRLTDVMARPDRELVLAAIGAAPSVPDPIWLLAPLAEVARSPDRPLAAAAARAAARIAGDLDIDQLLEHDVPFDWVRARLAQYRAQAADAGRWPDVRVSSLEVAAHLRRAEGARAHASDSPFDLRAALSDPEPELRRAALELTVGPLEAPAIEAIAARASADEDPAVVAAAAQALCEGLDFGDEARPVLEALGKRGLARLRELVTDGDQPAPARAAAARCLAADGSAASREAIDELRDDDESAADGAPRAEPEDKDARRPHAEPHGGHKPREAK